MDQPFLRILIQEKLADGRLPRAAISRVWGGPGHGEIVRRLRGDRDQRPDW